MKTTQLMAGLMAISMVASHAAFAQSVNVAPDPGNSQQGPAYNSEQPRANTPPPPPRGPKPHPEGERVAKPGPAHRAPPPPPGPQAGHRAGPKPAPGMAPHEGPKAPPPEVRSGHGPDVPALVSGSNATNASTGVVQLEKGGKLPVDYRSKQYIVSNWQDHQLSAPPRNHHWVQVGAHYALVANSGVIAEVH